LIPLERQLNALQLCCWQFLYNETLQQTFRPSLSKSSKIRPSMHFDPHFEEVRGGIEPWSMARWKALAEFLLSVIELLFLSLMVEALQGKRCQNVQTSGVGRSLWGKISGGRGRPWGIFFGSYKTRHILLSNGGNCTMLRAVVFTQYRRVADGQTDGQTDRQRDGRNCRS